MNIFNQTSRLPLVPQGPIIKIGDGELGGKARLLPFLDRLIRASKLDTEFAPHTIRVPETWVLTTDCFSDYVERNDLSCCAEFTSDEDVRRRFLSGTLAPAVLEVLRQYIEKQSAPIAVRSSALSEDAYHHTTAGLYATIFIPNRGASRIRQLEEAVKLVYASAFTNAVNRHMRDHSIPREDERMAIALESVVGTTHDTMHYPVVSGVAQSINYFPVGPMQPEDGVVTMVMGMGRRVVSGQDGTRFSPRYPLVRPSFQTDWEIIQTGQTAFDAVNLESAEYHLSGSETQTLISVPIQFAEKHGVLDHVASTWDADAGVFYESLFRQGPRVITFNKLLRQTTVPLPKMIQRVLDVVQDGFGIPVEVEFALDMKGQGPSTVADLVLLQVRPLPTVQSLTKVVIPQIDASHVLVRTSTTLGHGAMDELRTIVFIDPALFSLDTSHQIAAEVAALNDQLRREQTQYMLLGPGRWGSSNRATGIPVEFRDVDQACLIAEMVGPELPLEPSQGTHFFHNVVSRHLYYLTVDTRCGHEVNLAWMRAQPNQASTRFAKLIRSPEPLSLRVDASRNVGLIYLQT